LAERPRVRVPVRAGVPTTAFPAPSPTKLVRAQFDAARNHRRLRTWNPTSAEINTIMAYDGAQLLRRSRDLCRNNGYVNNAREVYATALVGTGIKMSWLSDDAALKAELQDLWLRWTWEADADGLCDWEGLQALVARELFEAGEVFVRLRARFPQDPMAVPFQLQLMPAEMLDYGYNTVNGTNTVVQGVEFDVLDRRVAYWFWRRHPGDGVTPFTSDPQTQFGRVRIPAKEVLHVFRPEYIGQVRGVPRTRTAMIPAKMLDDYNDAELDRKRTAALFCGFVTENASGDEVLPTTPALGGPLAELAADDDGTPLAPLEPATFQKLRPGEDVKFASRPTSAATTTFPVPDAVRHGGRHGRALRGAHRRPEGGDLLLGPVRHGPVPAADGAGAARGRGLPALPSGVRRVAAPRLPRRPDRPAAVRHDARSSTSGRSGSRRPGRGSIPRRTARASSWTCRWA
jgi:capsid protein